MHLSQAIDKVKEFLGDFYNPAVYAFKVICIIILTALAVKVGSFIIRKVFEKQKTFKYSIDNKRIDTMCTLLISVYRYTVYIIAAVSILTDVFDLKSVLAAAGIGGIAVGLGAQSLIKDIISGFFIVLEDQFVVGDLVTIDTMNGTVEEMELRITKLRSFNGDLYIIPNGEIKKVTNHTRGSKSVIVDIPVAYSADAVTAFKTAENICAVVAQEYNGFVEQPKVLGITELGKESMNLRITAKTPPNEQWEIERKIRKMVREEFEKEKIEFIDKNIYLSTKENKQGS